MNVKYVLSPQPKFPNLDSVQVGDSWDRPSMLMIRTLQVELVYKTLASHERTSIHFLQVLAQKSDYKVLIYELTCRFTPVRIPSVQTSLFHEETERDC